MAILPSHRLKLYRNFKAIEISDYHSIVRYYERLEDEIRQLDFDEYFDCTVAYANALFEIGAFGKHIVMADFLLETIIMRNIESWGGEDIYDKVLFRKAAAHYSQQEYPQAEHILRELVKLDPWEKIPRLFLQKSMFHQKPTWLPKTRAIAVLSILLSAVLIAVEIFVVQPFFNAWLPLIQYLYIGVFSAGILLLAGGEAMHSWQCHQKVLTFSRYWQKRKTRQSN